MSKLDKDQVLSDFTAAYIAKNGKEPSVEVKSGWYSIDGGKNLRLAAIEEMTQELSGSAPVAKAAEPAKAKKSAKKAAPVAKVAEAKSAGFKVVKKGDGYNPANFWLDYLASLNSDSRTPQGFY